MDEIFYGVETDTDSYSGSFDHQGVIIPPFNINIDEQHLQHLRENFNPLQNSNDNGIDIYIARQFIAT